MNTLLFIAILVAFPLLGMAQINTKTYNPATNVVNWPDAFHPDKANFYVYNDIHINATADVVWKILIEATEWHTFYKGSQKPVVIADGSSFLSDGVQFDFKTMGINLTPTIKEFVPNERMAWQVDSRRLTAWHAWVIVPTEDGVKLVTAETQKGFLTTMQKLFQPKKLLNYHELWLKKIKERAEGRVTAQ
jgi:hypothetical protein